MQMTRLRSGVYACLSSEELQPQAAGFPANKMCCQWAISDITKYGITLTLTLKVVVPKKVRQKVCSSALQTLLFNRGMGSYGPCQLHAHAKQLSITYESAQMSFKTVLSTLAEEVSNRTLQKQYFYSSRHATYVYFPPIPREHNEQ